MLATEFATLPDLIRAHGVDRPSKTAIADDDRQISYAELDRLMDRIAAALQRDGTQARQGVAMVSYPSVEQSAVFMGALRAGSIAAPIQPSATPEQIAGMIADSGANLVFLDTANAAAAGGPDIVRADRDARTARWMVGRRGRGAGTGDDRPARRVQHHLFVGHHRHAQGHRGRAMRCAGSICHAMSARASTKR